MAFGTATVVTRIGKAIFPDRVRTTPATYTAAPKFVAMGVGATAGTRTAAATDEALNQEVETRTSGTESIVTTTVTGDTYQVVGTVTATAARAVDEAGLFDVSTSAPVTTIVTTALTAGATSVTVASAAGFPGTGNYDIQVEQEVMTVTAGQGTTTWTITRGVNGSTAAAHAIGANVAGAKTTAGGNNFVNATFAVINLANADSIQFTFKTQLT